MSTKARNFFPVSENNLTCKQWGSQKKYFLRGQKLGYDMLENFFLTKQVWVKLKSKVVIVVVCFDLRLLQIIQISMGLTKSSTSEYRLQKFGKGHGLFRPLAMPIIARCLS